MSEKKKTEAESAKTDAVALGGCRSCSCIGFRDGGDGSCVNIRPPTKQLCGHSAADH